MRYYTGLVCLLAFTLSGCGVAALGLPGSATHNVESMLNSDYAKYVIAQQDAGHRNNIMLYDQWFDGKYNDMSSYGKYFNTCKMYPAQNEGGPLDYKDWIKTKPRPIAKIKNNNH